MGFINNHNNNFLPSNHPWGDDNTAVYKMPRKRKPVKKDINPSDLGYTQLCDMITQLSSTIDRIPNSEDKLRLRAKVLKLKEEKSRRDLLEAKAASDRNDNFDKKDLSVKEDVVITPRPSPKPEKIKIELDYDDLDLDDYDDEVQTAGFNDINNFLIASLIVITIISLTKK